MRKKLILFLMLALFGSTSFLRADEVTIGDPTSTTTNQYLPTYSLYNYSFTQQIYTADEIGMGGTINEFTMWLKNTSSYARNLNVYMKEVSETSFANGWVSMTDSDLVATGTLANGISDPVATTFTLTTPFSYSGEGNLVICFQDVTGSWSSGAASIVMTTSEMQAIYAYRDAALYDPTTPGVNGTQVSSKSVVMLDITASSGPTPTPTPTGDFTITPNDAFALGERPLNGWMEPFSARIAGAQYSVEASISNTSGENPFSTSVEINGVVPEDGIDFDIEINPNAPAGVYIEEFTLFYAAPSKDIKTIPVSATLYTADWADIVEKAEPLYLSYTNGEAEFTETPTDLHANYMLQGMTEMKTDAVYSFSLIKDSKFSVSAGDNVIAIYNRVNDFHPTAASEPVAIVTDGVMEEEVLLAGQYYMIVASNNITNVEGTVEQIPAPTEITNLTPADGVAGLEGNIVLTWEGGENATQYQVLFGTSPTNLPVAMDWTAVDDNYGTFDVTNYVSPNTQYFWQIKVKNSNGTVTGPRWGFTTALIAPSNVTASADSIFVDESTLIKWRLAGGAGFTGSITVADGTTTNSYVPVYGLWCDYYTRSEMIYPAEMLEEMVGGEITSLVFYLSSPATATWAPDVFQVYFQEVDATTLGTYYTAANAQICYTGYLDGTGATMNIVLDEPYHYNGGNLLLGIQETVNGTYKSASFYGVAATGASASGYNSSALASVTFNQRNFLPKVTFHCGDERNINIAQNRTHQGFNVYYGDVKANTELITENKYLLGNLPYNMEGHDVTVTAVYSEGESALSAPVKVWVSGYGTLTGTVTELISGAPIAGVNVKFIGKDEFNHNATFEGTTNSNGVYTINNVKAGNYTGKATLEGNEPSNSDPVTLAYNTTETVNFVMHEVYNPVMSVTAEEMDSEMSRVKWSMTEILPVPAFPVPGGNTPGGGGGGSTPVADETFDFENSSFQGWTTIDANNDNYNWVLGSQIGGIYLASGASLSGSGHNSSNDLVCSGSYSNATSQAITPDNYLVSPTKAAWTSISFFACAQDASYAAEHYGVAVSTTGNTSAADFTMVQEWTMTAKDAGAMSIGRNGETRAQGSWYEKTVDLSAYAGQDIWVAIRHFNCNDQFILNVDDITLHGSAKGTRDVQEYALYRAAILTEDGEPLIVDSIEDVTPYYITTVAGNTQYADFDWAIMEPGLYQYGVSAIYPSPAGAKGTRDEVIIGTGTATNSYVPTYNLYNYSCTNQIFTAEEIGGAGTINSIAFMPATVNTASRNLNVYMVNTEKTSFAGGTDWVPVTDADLVYSGNVSWVANTWCTIELTTPFSYDGSNLCVIVNDLTGSWTSSNQYYVSDATAQAIRIYQDSAPYNPAAPGSGTVLNVKNNIKLDITYGGSGNDNPVTPVVWSNVLPKDIWATVTINATVPVGTAEGAQVRFHNTFEGINDVVVTLDETGCDTILYFRKGEYEVTVDLLGYTSNYVNTPVSIWGDTHIEANFEEIFKPVETLTASRQGYLSWDAVIPTERVAEKYVVTLDGAELAQITDNFYQIDEDLLTVGQTYEAGVAVLYTTGISTTTRASFTYADCNGASHQVDTLIAVNVIDDTNVTLSWDGSTPNPNPNPNPNPGTGNTFDFDDGTMMGWTTIDANNDGYNWVLGSQIGGIYLVSGASLAGSGHNSSQDLVCSGSYSNATNQAITPDNYLVSPAKGQYTGISFWACGQDASYVAEHFGVAVSTTTATASAFTTVQEWTMTAKGQGAMSIGRDGQTRVQGSWHEYTVDLSAYAGQEIWVAIRHFNCNDMFILDVDDITLTVPSKELEAGTIATIGQGFGSIYNNVTDDGNWYYYDNGTNYDAIGLTSGGGFYWGIMFPAGTIEGNRLTKVSYFDPTPSAGTVNIYQGGTNAPGTQLYSQQYSTTGSDQVIEIEMGEPVEIDPEQNIWVVMHNTSGQYVASYDGAAPGQTNGSWLSTDGSTWYESLYSATGGSYGGNWNIRAYVEAGAGPAPSGLVANKYNIFFDGVLVGATSSMTFTYDAGDFNEHNYVVVWVDSDYLVSCVIEGKNSIMYAAEHDNAISENGVESIIYPNPTSGDVRINANNMVRISIVNTLGQVVYDKAVEGNEAIINMAQFGNGVYMVNIATENGTSVKRVIVSK